MFGTGHYNHVLDVGIMSSIENISSIVTGGKFGPQKLNLARINQLIWQ